MISILLPTDFSDNSINAIKYALEFFKYQRTEFFILHAYRNEYYDTDELKSNTSFEAMLESSRAKCSKNLEKLLKKIKKWAPHERFSYKTISAQDTLVEGVNKFAESNDIDCVIMGTKGKSDNRNIVFGSETFQVLKFVKCPVLAIPSNYNNTQPKRILFPTDYLTPYKKRELKLLSVLAKSYRSEIYVLYVSGLKELSRRQIENQQFLKNTLSDNTLTFHQVRDKNVSKRISDFVQKKEIDMLIMINTQHSFLEDMLFPSTIDKVSLGLEIPLLAMQNSGR